jgi:hypothetical protein
VIIAFSILLFECKEFLWGSNSFGLAQSGRFNLVLTFERYSYGSFCSP